MYADVIIDIAHEKLDKIFQYQIPEDLEGKLTEGMEVRAPFGKGDREIKGYIVGFSQRARYAPDKIKTLTGVSPRGMTIEARLIELAGWLKENYGGTTIQALRTVLPVKRQNKAKERSLVRLLLDEREGRERLALLLKKNQRARADRKSVV